MRVAYLCTEYPDVTHTFIRREIRGVERTGIDVVRLTIRKPVEANLPDPADREELSKTIGVLDRGALVLLDVAAVAVSRPWAWLRAASRAIAYGWRSNRGLLRHLAYLAEACTVLRVLGRLGANHVHAHFGENSAMVALLVKHLGGPGYSFQVHGPGEFDAPRFIHLPEKVAEARFVTAITDYARGQVLRWSAPQYWGKVHVIRCGVDEKFLEARSAEIPDQPRLLSIGRLSRSKAQPMLVEAVARLVREGRKFEVVLIGNGELREYLKRAIDERGISDSLKLVGIMSGDRVKEELLKSRALLLPSFGEGLPVVIMEAFALARPAIATQIAGIPELVVHGRNGWLIPAGNLDRLVEAMREALDAPVERLREMGAEGRAAVREKHDAAREAAKLAELFLHSATATAGRVTG
jgi:glycosyltransferase involved in cell wall biosynthesis